MTSPLDKPTRTARGLEAERVRAKVRSRLFQQPEVPVKIDRYVLEARVGEGAMGTVYRARDPELQRDVALKLLADAPREDKVLDEARAMAKLEHPNLLGIHDVGTFDGRVFLVMKFIDGGNLARWLEAQPRTAREIVRVFTAAARGLSAAHRAHVVHRDFKPENVLVDRSGHAVVADFGLARGAAGPLAPGALSVQTQAAGTPAYMAPELLEGGPATARSDQFAFFVALYEALAGALPFQGRNVVALRGAQSRGPQKSGRIPAWLERVIWRGLALDPAARHTSMDEVIALLDRGAPRARYVTAAVAMLAAGAVGAWQLKPRPQPVVAVVPVPLPAAKPPPAVIGEPGPAPAPERKPQPKPKPKPGVAANFNAVWDDAWAAIKAAQWKQCTKKEINVDIHWNGSGEVRSVKAGTAHSGSLTEDERACVVKVFTALRIPPFDHDAYPPVDSIAADLN